MQLREFARLQRERGGAIRDAGRPRLREDQMVRLRRIFLTLTWIGFIIAAAKPSYAATNLRAAVVVLETADTESNQVHRCTGVVVSNIGNDLGIWTVGRCIASRLKRVIFSDGTVDDGAKVRSFTARPPLEAALLLVPRPGGRLWVDGLPSMRVDDVNKGETLSVLGYSESGLRSIVTGVAASPIAVSGNSFDISCQQCSDGYAGAAVYDVAGNLVGIFSRIETRIDNSGTSSRYAIIVPTSMFSAFMMQNIRGD